jgi:hypothetical protein
MKFALLLLFFAIGANADVNLPHPGEQLVCDTVWKIDSTIKGHTAILSLQSGKYVELVDNHNVALKVNSSFANQVKLSGKNGFIDTNTVEFTLNSDGTGEITYDDFSPALSNSGDLLLSNCINQ